MDWVVGALSTWLILGFYLDLWAHAHGFVDDTFLTPWHAVLYSGASSFGVILGTIGARRVHGGATWRTALPAVYAWSFLGSVAFLAAGAFDLVWHDLYGFEVDTEALLSPAHLVLAASGLLMLSGPIRSAWSRPHLRGWRNLGPVVIGLTAVLAILAAFTQYAHPVVDPWAERLPATAVTEIPSQIHAMAPDGSAQRRLRVSEQSEQAARLSPDGTRLAFATIVDGSSQIVVAEANGAGARQVTRKDWNFRPAWSPDGTRLVFESNAPGNSDVFVMAPDGSGVRPLTSDAADDWDAVWSPDGASIAFVSNRTGVHHLYLMTATGDGVVQLTSGGSQDFDPDWSTDGSRIAFSSEREAGFEIWTMAADGSDLRRLTDSENSNFDPGWSPDGASIAFVSDRDGDGEVYLMGADGSNERNLSRSPGTDDGWYGPTWSADGRSILYTVVGRLPGWQEPFVRQGFGAAGVLIQAALLAGVALVGIRRSRLPFGSLTVLILVPTALMTVVSDQYRFIPAALVAGLVADVTLAIHPPGRSRRSDALLAFLIPALPFAGYFLTLALTTGVGWTIHLWLGAIVLAGIVGLFLDELARAHDRTREARAA